MAAHGRQSAPRFRPDSTVHQHTCTDTPVDIVAAATLTGTPTSVYISKTDADDDPVYISPVSTATSGIILASSAGSSSQALLIELSPGAAVYVSQPTTPADTVNAIFMYD